MRLNGKNARAALAAAWLAVAAAPAPAEERQVPQTRADVLLSFAPVARKVQPAVVNVYASRTEKQPRNRLFDDPVFRQFFGEGDAPTGGPTAQSLGSGVIVDPSGLVVTNEHVIEGMTDVKVALADKREVGADVVLRDRQSDLAVLRLKSGSSFPALELADSDEVEVGDIVLAVGDPFGVGQTVTQGIVSGLARTQVGSTGTRYFIQTDAAINPGNSGGALVDMNARLIGINSAIYSQSGGSIGIGFAIPVNLVRNVVAAARAGSDRIHRPWLGASLQGISREIADGLGLDRPSGALVADVEAGGPAAAAGLRRGDIVEAVDGAPVEDQDAFGYRLATKALGGNAALTVKRGSVTTGLALKLIAAPETPPRETVKLANPSPFSGATVVNLSPAVAEDLLLPGVREGVVVTDVEAGSVAAVVGIERGDVVLEINDAKMSSTRQVQRATAARRDAWRFVIDRKGQILRSEVDG